MEEPFSIETRTVLFLHNDDQKMTTKGINLKDKSLSLSNISLTRGDDDDNCSSSTVAFSESLVETECSISLSSSCELNKLVQKDEDDTSAKSLSSFSSFTSLRLNYLAVTLVIMLADGLQGTHLYVLYEGYGFNVASLYVLGFITGAVTTPITGPLIDRFGRKKSAILYCVLEMGINLLEQYPFFSGLLLSRMVGGITTNLLSSVFETWLDTEFRNRQRATKSWLDSVEITDDDTTSTFDSKADDLSNTAKNDYEMIMRDSVIISNLASIASGYLAHFLAETYGSVGPFQGAVCCTGIALVVISMLWKENYGMSATSTCCEDEGESKDLGKESTSHDEEDNKSVMDYMKEAIKIIRSNPKILYLGIIQGLSTGSLQIFIFLWSPTLQIFCAGNNSVTTTNDGDDHISLRSYFSWAVDSVGNPAYGLIFGAFMAAGVSGGICAPFVRRAVGLLFTKQEGASALETIHLETEGTSVRPMELEFLVGMNYLFAAGLMLIPSFLSISSPESFSIALSVFLTYEFLVGVTMPCEGVIRSLYLPSEGRATMTMVPRMVVNLAVSVGVLLTRYISEQLAFVAIALLIASSGILQLSFISRREWRMIHMSSIQHVRRLSTIAADLVWWSKQSPKTHRVSDESCKRSGKAKAD